MREHSERGVTAHLKEDYERLISQRLKEKLGFVGVSDESEL